MPIWSPSAWLTWRSWRPSSRRRICSRGRPPAARTAPLRSGQRPHHVAETAPLTQGASGSEQAVCAAASHAGPGPAVAGRAPWPPRCRPLPPRSSAGTAPGRGSPGSPAATAVEASQRCSAVHAAGDRPAVMRQGLVRTAVSPGAGADGAVRSAAAAAIGVLRSRRARTGPDPCAAAPGVRPPRGRPLRDLHALSLSHLPCSAKRTRWRCSWRGSYRHLLVRSARSGSCADPRRGPFSVCHPLRDTRRRYFVQR